MTERQIINLIETTLYEKIQLDENYIRYSFYEVNVKYPFKNKEERKMFLQLLKNKLINNNYNVYITGAEYEYKNIKTIVQDNELIIAIKELKK